MITERMQHLAGVRLDESLQKVSRFNITIKDIEKVNPFGENETRNRDFLVDMADEIPDDIKVLLKNANAAINKAWAKIKKFNPNVRMDYAIENNIINWTYNMPFEEKDFYPITFYVSATNDKHDTVGLLIDKSGKIEMFEGNDEATDETYALVNKIMGGGKEVLVYGSHSEKVINSIRKTNRLPKGLYISPKRSYAEGYWGEDRILFSVKINTADVRQESTYDWLVIGEPKIKEFKLL